MFWVSFIIQIKKKWIYVVGISMIILVGFSRLYLGGTLSYRYNWWNSNWNYMDVYI